MISSQSLRNVSPTTHAPSPPSIGARCFVGLAGYPARAELFAPRLRGVPAGTAALQELCTLLYGKPGCKSGVHMIVLLATTCPHLDEIDGRICQTLFSGERAVFLKKVFPLLKKEKHVSERHISPGTFWQTI